MATFSFSGNAADLLKSMGQTVPETQVQSSLEDAQAAKAAMKVECHDPGCSEDHDHSHGHANAHEHGADCGDHCDHHDEGDAHGHAHGHEHKKMPAQDHERKCVPPLTAWCA